MGSRLLRKKISSLIKKYTGSNEREKRAFEEPERKRRDKNKDFFSEAVSKKIKEFKYGDLIYCYYRYLNTFHTVPIDIADLFEFTDFMDVENEVHKLIQDSLAK